MSKSNPHLKPIILLNPGRQSRHYMLGLLRACETLGLHPGSIEMGPMIAQLARAPDPLAALEPIQARLRVMVEAGNFTDIITYANAGGAELGKWNTPQGVGTIWNALGLRHHILWTDHPDWATNGTALKPGVQKIYAHPHIFHHLKSAPAALEAAAILGWSGVTDLPVAEDYDTLRPQTGVEQRHDIVAILGSVAPVPEALVPFLDKTDPEPARLDHAMIPRTLKAWTRFAADMPNPDGLMRFARSMLELHAEQPGMTFWQHAEMLKSEYASEIDWLQSDPQRWYAAVGRLRLQSAWRRSFWLAWLARRVDLGIYGCDASILGIDQPKDARQWVEYKDQSRVYACGRCALNINQSHDEAGVTHKPFQIVASGVPLIHHATPGLGNLFRHGSEVLVFARGPELLHRIDTVCADNTKGTELAEAALTRAKNEHAWTNRVQTMLSLDQASALTAA